MSKSSNQVATNQAPKKRRLRRFFLYALGLLGIWLGLLAWFSYQLYAHSQQLRALLQTSPMRSSHAQALCDEVAATHTSAIWLRRLSLPIHPILRQSDAWIGALPAASDFANQGLGVAEGYCHQFNPLLALLDLPAEQRSKQLLDWLIANQSDWLQLQRDVQGVQQTWRSVPTSLQTAPFLANYQAQLTQFDQQLTAAQTSLGLLDQAWPLLAAGWGTQKPLRLLIAGQNPLELRPSGGFIGSIATMTFEQGRISNMAYFNSADFAAVAPAGSAMPKPYNQYLRASLWTLRDANWWPDWPTSAQSLQIFWQLNQQPEVDAVIALDLYGLQGLIQVLAPLEIAGYGQMVQAASLEQIFGLYDGQNVTGDKQFLAALFRSTLETARHANFSQWLELGASLQASLQQRHLSIYFNDQTSQNLMLANGWAGAMPQVGHDLLALVDADLSYSDGQNFIEQRMQLDVQLDAQARPLTNTLTITYTNRYDAWRADSSKHAVYGYCYNVGLAIQQRIPGCYGDYARAYLPINALPLHLDGADTPPDIAQEGQLTSVGWYMLLYPGQTRTIRLSYLPNLQSQPYQLSWLKQAGTLAHPIHVRISQAGQMAEWQGSLQHDRELSFIDAAIQPAPSDVPITADQQAAEQAWQRWQQGETSAALELWQASNTLDRALDAVVGLRWTHDPSSAKQLLQQLQPLLPDSGRAAFLAGWLAELTNDDDAALQAYQTALEREPSSQAARLALALLQLKRGDGAAAERSLQQLKNPRLALQRLAFDQRMAGDLAQAERYYQLLLTLDPRDRTVWEDRYWLRRYANDQPDWLAVEQLANEGISEFPNDATWLSRRAESYERQNLPQQAIGDWQQVSIISPTNSLAWYYLALQQRAVGDWQAAQSSLETLVQLDPQADYYLVLGDTLRELNLVAEARNAYATAAQINPDHPGLAERLRLLEASP
ncbi:DUF4012 domain-containing protein [Herpetosiphon llansteffanensis]|uniref:DUF4012 domain-containing protein n=1 Tax=Herpetosiphon llansteffanensis TaxID=2094568 RepID=UPI0013DF0395|nr:DUF4012 domain-containing protein [Herpetosiphon llansteffanensis]